jgi:hypothetical protein
LFVVAILAASVFSVVGLTALPFQTASAVVTIETSADDHGDRFFQGMLQVIIEDDTTDDDSDDSIDVEITVEEDGGNSDSATETIDDTSDGSQRFEFFLVHTDAPVLAPADPENDLTTVVFTFGDGAADFNVVDFEEFDSGSIEIEFAGQTITIDYDESSGDLNLDRDVFGTTSIVYVTVEDNDGNLDPTTADSFTVDATDLDDLAGDDDLFAVTGLNFTAPLTFDETGDNSAMFEAEVALDTDVTLDSEAITLTLHDKAVYTTVDDPNNTSTDTSQVSFTIDNEDGELAPLGSVTFGTEIKATVSDNDRNEDSQNDETITDESGTFDGVLLVTSPSDSEEMQMEETEDDSGDFIIDASNNELRVTFVEAGGAVPGNGILELEPGEATEDIDIDYLDCLTDDEDIDDFDETVCDEATDITGSATIELDITPGTIDLPETAGVNSDFTVTLNDADLNDNPRTRDSYTVEFDGALDEYGFMRGTEDLVDHAALEISIKGDNPTFADPVTVTFIETGINTGVFTAVFDMAEIIDETGEDLDDGDAVEITYVDKMEDPEDDSSDELTIGRADTGVDFSRDALPIPPADGSDVADALGTDEVQVTMTVTDEDANENSGTEEEIEVVLGTNFEVEIDGDGFDATIDSPTDEIDGGGTGAGNTLFNEILPIFNGTDLEETGPNTGVFEIDLVFEDGGLSADDWQDMVITFTYIDEQDDEESDGVTFRGNDGAVSVDAATTRPGSIITITVQDEDLNVSDQDIEEFDAVFDDGLLLIEAEDDDIDAVDQPGGETFTETGENTGVFMAEFEIGTDIVVAVTAGGDVEQASNLHITYNDEINSSADDEEIEVDVPVVTSTGSIQVSPELVGPGTEITILIVDSDLNQDPDSTDDYDPGDVEDLVEVKTDRDEVEGDEIPGLDETGPDTGVFEFTILLLPGTADECADEDVGDPQTVDGSEMEMGACPGDLLSLTYEDQNDANGNSRVVSEIVEISSWDPEFAADKDSYNVGDRATITIADPDANTDPDIADSLRDISVTSDTDVVGEELSALETGADTGVFRLSFSLVSSATGGGISVTRGDTVSIEYTDEFPADFEQEEEDKDFVFEISVGGEGAGRDATTPSPPRAEDVSGGELDEVTAGQQVVLTTSVTNNINDDQPFVALIEVRDSNGITVFIGWGTGVLNPSDQSTVGVSWTPQDPGDYEVRTFVIDDFDSPQVLSDVQTSDLTVS